MPKGILMLTLSKESFMQLSAGLACVGTTVYCHHVTIQFGVEAASFTTLIGRKFKFKVVEYCNNPRTCSAAVVKLPEELQVLLPEGKIPHVTMRCLDGIKPVESNNMLKAPVYRSKVDVDLTGTMEFQPFKVVNYV